MYISRLKLNNDYKTQNAIFYNPNIFHGAIEAAFQGDGGRKLWRVDQWRGDYYLLVTSDYLCDMSSIAEQFGAKGCSWESKEYGKAIENIKNNSFYKFRLVANPCRCEKGKRKAHTTPEHQKDWLITRAERNGFEIKPEWFDIKSRRDLAFINSGKTCNVNIASASFEGMLKVTDKSKFSSMLANGIGHAKAYGHGMMTVMAV